MNSSSSWLYENTSDNKARFVLGETGKNPLICFGINASTAEPRNLDRTLTNVRNQSILKNYDGWVMLNLYPQRATNPNNMHQEIDYDLHNKNIKSIKEIFIIYPSSTVWAAWGGLINKRPFLINCFKEIISLAPRTLNWVRRGGVVNGIHPHHPLYLRNDLEFSKFDVNQYLTELFNCNYGY